jgi:hypothetical protein
VPTRMMPSAFSATIIPLPAAAGTKPAVAAEKAGAMPEAPAARRGSRGGDLILGGVLAVVLLIACLTWEVLSRDHEALRPAGGQQVASPAVH